jgi:hypothetical protein
VGAPLSPFPQKTTSVDQSRKGRRAAACELDVAPAWILTRSTETPSCPWASAVTGMGGGAPASLRPRLARAARPLRARGRVSEAMSSEPVPDDAGIEEREQQEEETDQARHGDQRIGPVYLLLAPIRFLDLLHLSRTIGGKQRKSIGPETQGAGRTLRSAPGSASGRPAVGGRVPSGSRSSATPQTCSASVGSEIASGSASRVLAKLDCRAAAPKGASTRPLGDAWAWSRRSSLVDVSPLVASTLALWACTGMPEDLDDPHIY